jgi:hypothetical protein
METRSDTFSNTVPVPVVSPESTHVFECVDSLIIQCKQKLGKLLTFSSLHTCLLLVGSCSAGVGCAECESEVTPEQHQLEKRDLNTEFTHNTAGNFLKLSVRNFSV